MGRQKPQTPPGVVAIGIAESAARRGAQLRPWAAGRRLFMRVIDGQSFDAGDSRGVAVAAR